MTRTGRRQRLVDVEFADAGRTLVECWSFLERIRNPARMNRCVI